MAKIEFYKMTIEGFGSIVNETLIDLSGIGITLIKGKNGAGKSSLFNALYWCLYGKSVKNVIKDEIPTWEKLRPENFKGTRVWVVFSVNGKEYQIIRHINYTGKTFDILGGNSLLIYENGEKVKSENSKVNQQVFINELLGMDSKVFLHTCFFAQKINRFVHATAEEKRTIIESIFEFDRIDKAKELAIQEYNTITTELAQLNLENQTIIETLNRFNTEIKLQTEKAEMFESLKAEKLKNLNDKKVNALQLYNETVETLKLLSCKVNALKQKLLEFNHLNNKLKETEITEKSLKQKRVEIEKEINDNKLNIQLIKQKYSGVCGVCGITLETLIPESAINAIEAGENLIQNNSIQLKQITENIEKCLQEKSELSYQLQQIQQLQQEIKNVEKEIDEYLNKQNKINLQIQELDNTIKTVETETFNFDFEHLKNQIKSLNDKADNLKAKTVLLEKELAVSKYFGFIGFTGKGLKAFLFDEKLKILNRKIAEYAYVLGVKIYISVDFEKVSKSIDIMVENKNCISSYNALSGGEQQRIDLCIAFALHDLIDINRNINILILDEVFESIDNYGGVEQIIEMIMIKATNKKVFVISHNNTLEIPYASCMEL